jgi:hypothetical protein
MTPSATEVVRKFLELEQHLCRIENRTTVFQAGETNRPDRGHHALAGVVLREARDFLKGSGLSDVPSNRKLAEYLNVGPNQITHLFDGQPPKHRNWCRDSNGALAWLLQETIDNNSDGLDAAALAQLGKIKDRICHFFFFSLEPPGKFPAFFAFERRFATIPCSLQELAHEIAWFARQPDVGGFRTEINVILGSSSFPPHDPRKLVLARLQEAVLNGVVVNFILHRPGTQANGLETIEQFQKEFPGVRGKIRCLEAASDGLYENASASRRIAGPLSEAGILFPWGHTLYMHSITQDPRSDEPDQEISVYLHLRHFTPVHPPLDHHPVAYAATQAEEAAFRRWRSTWREEPATAGSQERPLDELEKPQPSSRSES